MTKEHSEQEDKEEKINQDQDYYINDEGYIVFTESFHLKRGYCCKNGCKHCPYGSHIL